MHVQIDSARVRPPSSSRRRVDERPTVPSRDDTERNNSSGIFLVSDHCASEIRTRSEIRTCEKRNEEDDTVDRDVH